jgi:diphthamide synthase (EF-2-diphthine--ammonia ligase)
VQAERAGLPLTKVSIPAPCPNEVYEAAMLTAMNQAKEQGVTHVLFGDLYLADIRSYREANLAKVGMQAAFPLWGRDTRELAREMVDSGLRAVLTCVDPRRLPASFAGRIYDHTLLRDLPADVDPCGENGEFHTCVIAGPMLSSPLAVTIGEVVERDGFVFADVTLE